MYAQIIDDLKGVTLAAASTLDKDFGADKGNNIAAAAKVGKLIAERAKKAGIEKVQFDRGQYLYHGRVKAVAEGAREGGLVFKILKRRTEHGPCIGKQTRRPRRIGTD